MIERKLTGIQHRPEDVASSRLAVARFLEIGDQALVSRLLGRRAKAAKYICSMSGAGLGAFLISAFIVEL